VDAPIATLPLITETGYQNAELFTACTKNFAQHTKPTEDNTVLLILENHTSHSSFPAEHFCEENFTTLLSLPTHANHTIQPLDL
jgi:hypothetical protein